MVNPELRFLTNEAGENEGLGDGGIETFTNSPYASCAREAGQNSRDASSELPVRMTFNVLNLNCESFPCRDRLENTLKACMAESVEERELEFFGNALNVIQKDSIPVLEIADYNTKGLTGPPDQAGKPFHSLVKGSGVTAKDNADSGGSFGIGKNATYAVSDLHTVFYSTAWMDPDSGQNAFAAQGKIKLVSHTSLDGEQLRATGYWGDPDGFRATTDRTTIPAWMARTEIGTSIFCMGFRMAEDWAKRMTSSLVTNFFSAIHREEMIFEVDGGRFNINRNTLEHLLFHQDIIDAGDQSYLNFAQQLYRCLVSDIAEEQILEIPDLGRMRIRVLIEEGMPRRIGFIRKGMIITDNLRHFGHPLVRFPGSRDFIVLVEPVDTDTSVFLKKLENSSHDAFSAERITDAIKRARANSAMKRLGYELREIIRKTAGVKHEGAVVLDELGRFFADGGQAQTPPDPTAESDPERYTYKTQRRNTRKPRHTPDPNGDEPVLPSPKPWPGPPQPHPPMPIPQSKRFSLKDVRNRIRPDGSGREIHFTPSSDGRIELRVEATGIDRPENLIIASANKGTVNTGAVIIEVKASERESVTVTFDEPYDGPIELIAITRAQSPEGTA